MQVETADIRKALIALKTQTMPILDRASKNRAKDALTAKVAALEELLMWVVNIEKTGEIKMPEFKLGEYTTWEPKPRKDSIDSLIIDDAKSLPRKDKAAIKVTSKTVKWTTFSNRTYYLNQNDKIDNHIFPRKDHDGNMYLVYLEQIPKRARR